MAEEQKTVFSTYMLKGEANLWWESKKNLEEEDLDMGMIFEIVSGQIFS